MADFYIHTVMLSIFTDRSNCNDRALFSV